MKPLLRALLWTEEDMWVWNRQALQGRFHAITPDGKYFDWLGHYETADRRDANLMLWAQAVAIATAFSGRRVRQCPRLTPVRVTGIPMKPLLRRTPLTLEDWCIWQRFELSPATWALYECSIPSDRRDAELMLYAQQTFLGYVVRNTDFNQPNSIIWVRAPQ